MASIGRENREKAYFLVSLVKGGKHDNQLMHLPIHQTIAMLAAGLGSTTDSVAVTTAEN